MSLLDLLEQGYVNTCNNFIQTDDYGYNKEYLVLRKEDDYIFYDVELNVIALTFHLEYKPAP